MIDILTQYGFTFRGTCYCSGPKTFKYKNGDFTVMWIKSRQKFRLKQSGKVLTTLKPESEIEQVLNQYVPAEA